MVNGQNDGMDLLNNVLQQLEKKSGKGVRKKAENIRRYMKDEGVVRKHDYTIVKQKVKYHIRLREEDIEKRDRERDISNGLEVSKNPLMAVVIFKGVEKIPAYQLLVEAQELSTQCLIYDFDYKVKRHQLLLSCESCYYAYKEKNKFCELMVKAIWTTNFFMRPRIWNKEWK